MREVRDIGDLRPAPRTVPAAVLWALAFVAVSGAAVLATAPDGRQADKLAAPRSQRMALRTGPATAAASAVVAHAEARP